MSLKKSSASAEAATSRLALLVLCCLAIACTPEPGHSTRKLAVFGTIVQVEVVGAEAAVARAALDQLEELYRRIDMDWRSFGSGELAQANLRLESGQPVELSAELARIVARAMEIQRLSGGLFDPRIGGLIHLWGFDDLARQTPAGPPEDAAIDAAREALHGGVLHLDGRRLSAAAPIRLELSGVAKGSALAAGAATLRAAGIDNALIVAGGDVIALGKHGQRPWRIGVRNPVGPGILGRVALEDGEAAVSSGTYERFFEDGGESYHHLLDPRTGWPAAGGGGSTVISRDPELANAAALALLIGGASVFAELSTALGVDCALLTGHDGQQHATACMKERLQP